MLSIMNAGVMNVNIVIQEGQHTTGAQTVPVTVTITIGGRGVVHGTAQLAAVLFIKLDRESLASLVLVYPTTKLQPVTE